MTATEITTLGVYASFLGDVGPSPVEGGKNDVFLSC